MSEQIDTRKSLEIDLEHYPNMLRYAKYIIFSFQQRGSYTCKHAQRQITRLESHSVRRLSCKSYHIDLPILTEQVPHPLFPTFELRVQTDGEITPKQAVLACCKDLVADLASFARVFKREYELRKMVGQDQ